MVLYLLHHGETGFNVAGRFQGQRDSLLTARGRSVRKINSIDLLSSDCAYCGQL